MNKIILSLLIAGVLVVGTITTATMVDAQRPPEKDPDEDNLLEGVVWEIIGMLKHPDWGLEIIDDEVEHIHGELHNATYGLPVIELEVDHNHDELHHADWGLPVIDDEVEENTALLEDDGFGLEEIDDEVEHIHDELHDTDYGLEEIHGDVHETARIAYAVKIDMRFNQYDLVHAVDDPPGNDAIVKSLANRFGIKIICPTDDPNCGEVMFSSAESKNVYGYTYPNRNYDSHADCLEHQASLGILTPEVSCNAFVDIEVGLVNFPRLMHHLQLDRSGTLIWSNSAPFDIPVPVPIGLENNILMEASVGQLYGKQLMFTTAVVPFTGIMEFIVYAPEGTTFKHIWACDNLNTPDEKLKNPTLAAGASGIFNDKSCNSGIDDPMTVSEFSTN